MPKQHRVRVISILALLALGSFIIWKAWPRPELVSAPAPPEATAPPRYEAYPVTDAFEGPSAAVVFTPDDPALMFRTVIRRAAAEGPDFAGKYAVASWGCGTACQQNAVIDAETGRIVAFNLMTSAGVEHRLDSRLLVAMEPSATIEGLEAGLVIPSYYVMDGGNLRLVGRLVDGKYEPFR